MKILITGGLGFIGSTLAKKCVDLGYDVTIITRTFDKINNVESILEEITILKRTDITTISSEVIGFDVIFHCASTVDNYNIFDNPYLDANTNINGTIALLEACRVHNPNVKVIFTSTFFVNGNPPEMPVTPDMKPEPLGLYGATKLCAEHILKTYNRVFDIDIRIARLSNVFGLRE
jgi:nucleoside-diphosphate-sugar epimerase